MEKRTEDVKFKVTASEKEIIERKAEKARYNTRAAYLRDSALLGAPVHLTDIALSIGQLSLLCNELLCEADESDPCNRPLSGSEAKKAVKKIMLTCDAVRHELQEITSCARI
ncbi:hypothetical protein KDD17_02600 [Sulfitobacter albidus]|uniref:Mobilization protein n=1 Tax=Sulfitobacter albidus TaxID=2829501 RepID=A0A975JEE9_9RHOB|nr:hypothetical protein [Sulfitobacter albidus]QUJ76959.1 hypothetical protein KDD17_02600 [Sulfitobacter albidus]